MLIDWFTVIAQALNFLVLVVLMRLFLYKPILRAIDEREKKISVKLADAEKKKSDAQKESDELKHKNEEFDQQRSALLSKATDDAQVEQQKLLDEARKTAAALSLKQQETLKNDARNLNQEISRRTKQEVFSIARKALSDLAGTSLEECMVNVFVRRLQELNGKEKDLLISSIKASTGTGAITVSTAFDLSPEQCALTEDAIKEFSGAEVQVLFETAPELISGIELTANGQKLTWSIADYLSLLEKGVDKLLKQNDMPEKNGKPILEKAKPKKRS
jgi:F-type H+-transporting ATPase subunit b